MLGKREKIYRAKEQAVRWAKRGKVFKWLPFAPSIERRNLK